MAILFDLELHNLWWTFNIYLVYKEFIVNKMVKCKDFDLFANGTTDANQQNATQPFTWKGCNFWVVATWREYEILKKIFYSEWNLT